MKILILDDQPERHEGFIKIYHGHELTHTWTYSECVRAMKATKFDLVCLDHDLGDLAWHNASLAPQTDKVKVESLHFNLEYSPDYTTDSMYGQSLRRYMNGKDVVYWMLNNEFNCPKNVLIHSWNVEEAKIMHENLSKISWINITREPFRAPR